jgi:enamine deaminase RidA (YjgF/YER057c/UK114 family)
MEDRGPSKPGPAHSSEAHSSTAHRSAGIALSAALATVALAWAPLASAQEAVSAPDERTRSIHVPSGWEGAYDFGYAPVIRVGDWVIVSGIPAGGEGSYEDKVRRMYQRAKALLEEAGASIDDVIELNTYHVEPKTSEAFQQEFARYMPIHREFFQEHRPTWTAVGGSVLLSPTAVVEMRVVAVAGSGASSRVVRPDR